MVVDGTESKHSFSEIRVYHCAFLPLLEILWHKKLRKGLEFLRSNEDTIERLLEDFKGRRPKTEDPSPSDNENNNCSTEQDSLPFVVPFGQLRWGWNDDNIIYLKHLRPALNLNLLFRPLVPLEPIKGRWLSLEKSDLNPKINTSTSTVRLYPHLIAEVEKSYSIINAELEEVKNIVKKTRIKFEDERVDAKIRLLKAIFTDYSDIFVAFSETLTLIELKGLPTESIPYKSEMKDIDHILNIGWVHELRRNFWIVYYNNEKPPKVLRKRMLKALKTMCMIRTLRSRMQMLLDYDIFELLSYAQRKELLEFILNHLDPRLYSSPRRRTYFLPAHYQRILMKKIEKKIKERRQYKLLESKIRDVLKNWEPHELLMLKSISGPNIIALKNSFLSRDTSAKPYLEEDEEALLEFLIEWFNKEVDNYPDPGMLIEEIKRRPAFGGITQNKIVENIKKWLVEHKYDINLISENELKQKEPALLRTLERKGLIKRIPGEGRVKCWYVVDLKDEYISSRVLL